MRIIKFRGKRRNCDEWVYGNYIQITGRQESFISNSYSCTSSHAFVVKPETIGQFTGLLDKNGNEIYEGDIVKNKEIGGYGYEYIGVVKYYENDCRFGIDTTATDRFTKRLLFTEGVQSFNDGHYTITYTNEHEVLGNIHDNPELLNSL